MRRHVLRLLCVGVMAVLVVLGGVTPGAAATGGHTITVAHQIVQPANCPVVATQGHVTANGPMLVCPHPRCTGPTCVGKDPQTLGCGGSNGTDLASVTAPGGGATITLRWSDWCTANWADISEQWPDDWFVETADGHVERYSGDGNWTFMVDGVQLARACVQGYGHANYACTAWY